MDIKQHNPSANVPKQRSEDPQGDTGTSDKAWTPGEGEQGISNRVNDEGDEDAFEDEDQEDDLDDEEDQDDDLDDKA